MPYGGARVHKCSMATLSGQKTSSQSSDHLSVILERYCAICWLQRTNKAIEAFPSPSLLVCLLQAFIGGKAVLVSLPYWLCEVTLLCIVTMPWREEWIKPSIVSCINFMWMLITFQRVYVGNYWILLRQLVVYDVTRALFRMCFRGLGHETSI